MTNRRGVPRIRKIPARVIRHSRRRINVARRVPCRAAAKSVRNHRAHGDNEVPQPGHFSDGAKTIARTICPENSRLNRGTQKRAERHERSPSSTGGNERERTGRKSRAMLAFVKPFFRYFCVQQKRTYIPSAHKGVSGICDTLVRRNAAESFTLEFCCARIVRAYRALVERPAPSACVPDESGKRLHARIYTSATRGNARRGAACYVCGLLDTRFIVGNARVSRRRTTSATARVGRRAGR